MIVYKPTSASGRDVTVWLRPNRALSHGGIQRLAWGLAAVALATALIGAHQGNVFAPMFALLEAVAVAWALGVAWRAGNKGERITVDPRSVEVEFVPGHRRTSFPSGWVRVLLAQTGNRQRLLLAVHGREVEIGAFLADAERKELGHKLKLLLVAATSAGQTQEHKGSDGGSEGCRT